MLVNVNLSFERLLTRTHLQDLIETTALTHYETFRSKQLIALKENASNPNRQSQLQKDQGQTSQQSNQDLKNTSGVPNAPMFQSTTGTAAAR